jgi:predicted deacylase
MEAFMSIALSSAAHRRRALQLFKLKARARFFSAVHGPELEAVAEARARRADLAKQSVHGTGRVITQEEAFKLIAAKRQAAARPNRSRRARARVGRGEVF